MPALTSSEFTVRSFGHVIVSGPDCPVLVTVTVKLQESPLGAVHITTVLPIEKLEPEGGLQTTLPESVPQSPDAVGVE